MKKVLFMVLGISALLFLCAVPSLAQIYELSFTGTTFNTPNETQSYNATFAGYMQTNGQLRGQLNFPSWASGLKISRLSATVYDNDAGGYVGIGIQKVDRWTGAKTQLCYIMSPGESTSVQFLNVPASSMTSRGIDNNRYSFYFYAFIGSNTSDLRLITVTVRFQ